MLIQLLKCGSYTCMYAVFVHKQAFGNVFPDVYRKVHFPIYSVLRAHSHFPALWKYFAVFFRLWGKEKKARETKSGRSSHLSHISPSPCLLLPPYGFHF